MCVCARRCVAGSSVSSCKCVYVCVVCIMHFDAINFACSFVDMQSLCGSFFTVGLCCLCKHQNVIKTNRSGFFSTSFFCFLAGFGFALAKSGKAALDEFSFSLCVHGARWWFGLHNICIHAASNTVPTTIKVHWKWKFMALCLANALIASLLWWLSLFHRAAVFSLHRRSKKLKIYDCGDFCLHFARRGDLFHVRWDWMIIQIFPIVLQEIVMACGPWNSRWIEGKWGEIHLESWTLY